MEGQIRQSLPEANYRRVRTSAAMIGLAISMGTSSLLIPGQADPAIAAESQQVAETNGPKVAQNQEVTNKSTPELRPVSAQVQLETTKTQVAKLAQPELPQAIANGNQLGSESVTPEQQQLKNSPENNTSAAGKTELLIEQQSLPANKSESYVKPNLKLFATEPPQSGEIRATSVNQQLKTKQDAALDKLKESSNRLKNSLAELRSEEYSSSRLSSTQLGGKPTAIEQPKPVTPAATPEAIQPIVVESATTVVTKSENQAPNADRSLSTVSSPKAIGLKLEKTAAVVVPSLVQYQVSSGDTIDEIANNYGVSPQELVKANHLSDPNWLQVNQPLEIPQDESLGRLGSPAQSAPKVPSPMANVAGGTTQAIALVPELVNRNSNYGVTVPTVATVANPEKSDRREINSQKLSQAIDNEQGTSSASAKSLAESGTEPQVIPTQVKSGVIGQDSLTQTGSVNSEAPYNPYVENLRGEILKLREKYRAQRKSDRTDLDPARVSVVVPKDGSANQPNLPLQPVNSELNLKNYDRTLSVEKTRQQARVASKLQPLPNQAPNSTSHQFQAPLVATGPLGVGNYDASQPLLGQNVAPNLPPLAPADTYLPKNSAIFTGYIWPAKGVLTSGFGWRWGRLHAGIDIAAPIGTPVVASAPGVITYARWNDGGYGNLVEVTHPDGSTTLYGHNDRILVQEGQTVEQGQEIAEMGTTGYSTGPHSHFEVHPPGQGAVNPIAFLPR